MYLYGFDYVQSNGGMNFFFSRSGSYSIQITVDEKMTSEWQSLVILMILLC